MMPKDDLWCQKMIHDAKRWSMMSKDDLWCQKMIFDVKRWPMMPKDDLWCQEMIYDVKRWSMMPKDDLWCQKMICDVKRWSMMSKDIINVRQGPEYVFELCETLNLKVEIMVGFPAISALILLLNYQYPPVTSVKRLKIKTLSHCQPLRISSLNMILRKRKLRKLLIW